MATRLDTARPSDPQLAPRLAGGPACLVAHLSSVHQVNDVRIVRKECVTLREAGFRVALVVPAEASVEACEVELHPVPLPRDRSQRMLMTTFRIFRMARALDATLYHLHDPELIPVGLLLKALGRKVIYDAHEDLPSDIRDKSWIPRSVRAPVAMAAAAAEWLACWAFDRIVAATPAIARRFPADRTTLVQNFPLPGELTNPAPSDYAQRAPDFAYVGGIQLARGAAEMVDAIGLLPAASGAVLRMAGPLAPPSLGEKLSRRSGWARVRHDHWRDRPGIARLLSEVRAGLVLFHPLRNHVESQPNKLFEYMAAGLPVVASAFPLWRQIVEDTGCGLLVDPTAPQAIAEAMAWILDHPVEAEAMGQRGLAAVMRTYNWAPEGARLTAIYRHLTGAPVPCAG